VKLSLLEIGNVILQPVLSVPSGFLQLRY
jgi:hypothetical protein